MKCPKCQADNPESKQFCGDCGTQLISLPEGQPSFTKTLETPPVKLTRGTLLAGRFEIIEELGVGGMGRVYRVEDTKVKEEVALKLIRTEISSDDRTIDRFRHELKIARKIRHKNVTGMYDLGEDKGTHFITMEYVAGQDLRGLIRQTGQLTVGKAIAIGREIAEGLEEAHKQGIVHRDLKPSNIMIDREGTARIMDFGIARTLKDKSITGSGVIIGTPEYMSPEQVEGKEVDERSDIYSLGVILYEMVTGKAPFEGDTPFAIGMKHKSEMPQNPRELNSQIPEVLSGAILKCLSKDKQARYQTADELRSALAGIEDGISTAEKQIPKRKPITSKEITVKFNLRKLLVPALIVVAASISALLLFRRPRLDVDPNRVVVAVFENQTGDKLLDPLGRMASDWIAQRISQAGDIEVVPTMAVLQTYRMLPSGGAVSQDAQVLRTLAEDTGAGTMVYGTYYLTNQALYFQAHITDVQSQKLINSIEPVKGSLEDKMKVIQLLSRKVMDLIAVYFDKRFSDVSIAYGNPPAYEAYNEFLLGTEFFGVDYAQAIRHFSRAVKLDPSFLLPKMYVAVAYGNQGRYEEADTIIQVMDENREELTPFLRHMLDWFKADLKGDRQEALRSIVRAEELVPRNIVINYMHGFCAVEINHPQEAVQTYARMDSDDLETYFNRVAGSWRFEVLADALHMLKDHRQELKETRKGMDYYPNRLWLRADEARALAALGKIDAVREVIDKSLVVVPSAGTPGDVMLEAARELRAHGLMEAYLEIAARAVGWYQDQLRIKGESEGMRLALATALYTAERWDEAQAMFGELAESDPDNIEYKGRMGLLAARRGERDKALQVSADLGNITRPFLFGEHTYMRARIVSLLGETEQAVILLRNAFAQGLRYGVHLSQEMDLEPLRDYGPFQDLLKPKG